ncbi:transcription activator of gluconeogenesis [Calycina marina]|uniref:Transcription activator of gluconeogenesis n=1 Tax=Calycina marina TaxID=1763456 RepID=A0A9P8CI63_9HELO|nr:transcription activator of gluconeogenesis [Calycina marina]
MSGDTEIGEHEVSDGISENDRSDHDRDIGREEDDNTDMAEQKFRPESDEDGPAAGSTVNTKPKLDPRDPLRPRRKKARRACFACQRAHLTCGDERPCQRCIKRGLADACQDGIRKKAKYLHDAPPEALRPVLGPNFNPGNNNQPNNSPPITTPVTESPQVTGGNFFAQPNTSPTYPIFSQTQTQMAPPSQARRSYSSQQLPMSPNYASSSVNLASLQGMSVPQVSNDQFGAALFDPSNPALFNFDLEGLNFGNQYGAMEFGMLGHMSSGAAETPPKDNTGSISSQGMGDVNYNSGVYGSNMSPYSQMYSQGMVSEFTGLDQQNTDGMFSTPVHHGLPHAYAIATGTGGLSPSTDNSPSATGIGFDSSPNAFTPSVSANTQPASHRPAKRQNLGSSKSKFGPSSAPGKRMQDPSFIYDTVNEPYSYTAGFHGLTAFLQRRFSANKTLRIAKSLASIRPSFISCTKGLNRQDLIFMEKCFQRTLFEYQNFMVNCSTPTLVCRRTGEIAAVNPEFTLMCGWRPEVLLGKEPNLNTNNGNSDGSTSGLGSGTNTSRTGLTTPRMKPLNVSGGQGGNARPQPVFLAELLDDDSVIEFYEDFSKLAFGDSRGSVTTTCKVLKYRPKDANSSSPEGKSEEREKNRKRKDAGGGIGGMGSRVREIDGEHGIERLERDGKLDCSYCWTVKRDVFDIPMLIVMNFLPCI